MKSTERVPIVRKDFATIYGRVVDSKGKLGQFEVISELFTNYNNTYSTFSEAENMFKHYEFLYTKKN